MLEYSHQSLLRSWVKQGSMCWPTICQGQLGSHNGRNYSPFRGMVTVPWLSSTRRRSMITLFWHWRILRGIFLVRFVQRNGALARNSMEMVTLSFSHSERAMIWRYTERLGRTINISFQTQMVLSLEEQILLAANVPQSLSLIASQRVTAESVRPTKVKDFVVLHIYLTFTRRSHS